MGRADGVRKMFGLSWRHKLVNKLGF